MRALLKGTRLAAVSPLPPAIATHFLSSLVLSGQITRAGSGHGPLSNQPNFSARELKRFADSGSIGSTHVDSGETIALI